MDEITQVAEAAATEATATEAAPAQSESTPAENSVGSVFDAVMDGAEEVTEGGKPPAEATKTEAETSKEGADDATEASETKEVDLDAVFEPEAATGPDLTKIREALASSPELLAELDNSQTLIESERVGFQKLHEQATALKSIVGVQSLFDLTKPIEYGLDEAERWRQLKSEETRETALQSIVADISFMTGLDADQISALVAGYPIEAKEKPIQKITDEMALSHLGLKKDELVKLKEIGARESYTAATAAKWAKVSSQVGFQIDPVRMFAVEGKAKDLNVEQKLAIAYPKEYATWKTGGTQTSKSKQEVAKEAVTMVSREVKTPKSQPLNSSSDILGFVTT